MLTLEELKRLRSKALSSNDYQLYRMYDRMLQNRLKNKEEER
jgi:hypothetical protein